MVRKGWILGLVAGIAAATILLSWGWQQWQPRFLSGLADAHPSDSPSLHAAIASSPTVLEPPTVDADRLMADVEALAVERYTEADRQQTRTYLISALEQAGWTVQRHSFDGGINLYAEQPGTDPAAGAVILAAHYDSVEYSPGADDNATSLAVLLEVARLLRSLSFPHSLDLVFFDLEEAGVLGSTAFVADQVVPNLQAAIVLDMVGYACRTEGCQSYPEMLPIQPTTTRGDFLAVIGDRGHADWVDRVAQAAAGRAALPPVLTLTIPTLGRFTPDLVRSDHAPFWRNGQGAILITDTANFRNPHYHQPSDQVGTIDPTFLVGSAQIIVNALTDLLHN